MEYIRDYVLLSTLLTWIGIYEHHKYIFWCLIGLDVLFNTLPNFLLMYLPFNFVLARIWLLIRGTSFVNTMKREFGLWRPACILGIDSSNLFLLVLSEWNMLAGPTWWLLRFGLVPVNFISSRSLPDVLLKLLILGYHGAFRNKTAVPVSEKTKQKTNKKQKPTVDSEANKAQPKESLFLRAEKTETKRSFNTSPHSTYPKQNSGLLKQFNF